MELRQHDRDYLAVLDELDGDATTTEIRKRTEMDNRQVNYRHDKLAREDIVTLEIDNSLTPEGAAGMRVASLTEKGERLLADGAAIEGETEETVEERVDDLSARIDEVENTMHGAFPWMQEIAARIRRIEAFLEENGADLDKFSDVEKFE